MRAGWRWIGLGAALLVGLAGLAPLHLVHVATVYGCIGPDCGPWQVVWSPELCRGFDHAPLLVVAIALLALEGIAAWQWPRGREAFARGTIGLALLLVAAIPIARPTHLFDRVEWRAGSLLLVVAAMVAIVVAVARVLASRGRPPG